MEARTRENRRSVRAVFDDGLRASDPANCRHPVPCIGRVEQERKDPILDLKVVVMKTEGGLGEGAFVVPLELYAQNRRKLLSRMKEQLKAENLPPTGIVLLQV